MGEERGPRYPGVPDDPIFRGDVWAPVDWTQYMLQKVIGEKEIPNRIHDDISNYCNLFSVTTLDGTLYPGMPGDPYFLMAYLRRG